MKPSKVIISTDKEYSEEYEYILEELFNRKIELFCAWGKYCGQWETAMDLFVAAPERYNENHHITTTSHSKEPFEDVINMADLWSTQSGDSSVEKIKL